MEKQKPWMRVISRMSERTPAENVAIALYNAVGRPAHITTDEFAAWVHLADRILADPRYELSTVVAAIRWLKTNDHWRKHCCTMALFRRNIDAVLSEYCASKPPVTTRDPRLSQLYDLRAAARKELVEKFDCPDCHGVVDGTKRACDTCSDEYLRIYNRLFREQQALKVMK